MNVQFVDEPEDGRTKYGPMLDHIEKVQANDVEARKQWAILNTFENEQSARDAAFRLKGLHPKFLFRSVKEENGTNLLATLKEEFYE